MGDRALSFGAVAANYEKHRPGYPEQLADRVLGYAGRPVRTALEIGAGTGKATRLFAGRGIEVTATDPDAAMLAELAKHVPPSARIVVGAFEELALTETYDLVFAAASLHWTEPAGRWSRIAALLEPGGVFASFGGQLRLADAGLEDAVRAARADFLPDDSVASPDGWPGTELSASSHFNDVQQSVLERPRHAHGTRLRRPTSRPSRRTWSSRHRYGRRVRPDPGGAAGAGVAARRPDVAPGSEGRSACVEVSEALEDCGGR